MLFTYLDASALAKRYVPEPGTAVVNHLFVRIPRAQMIVLNVGLGEVVSILLRKRNAGKLPRSRTPKSWQTSRWKLLTSSRPRKSRLTTPW
jgi:predicted nucleic acid-binding protein